MINKVLIYASLMALYIARLKAQCVPDPVFYIYLDNTTLWWNESANCDDTTYIVDLRVNGFLEFLYHVNDTKVDVSDALFCRAYVFTVSPVSGSNVGPFSQILQSIQLPEDTTIIVTNFTGSQIDRELVLQWNVQPEYSYCVDFYKLLLWDEESVVGEEIITGENDYYILDVAQCMKYHLELSALHQGAQHPVAEFNYTVPPTTNFPTVSYIRQDTVTINTTWALEAYSVNRCRISALHVNGTGFNMTIPIIDSPERPTIDVTVSGLKANTMYYFQVAVENEAGLSTPYQLAVQTLPVEMI